MFRYLSVVFLFTITIFASDGLHINAAIGYPFSFDNQLELKYNDKVHKFNAEYEPKAFSDFPYWTLRTEYWRKDQALGIELVHHKLYWKNKSADVENFSVSDGYNLLYLNYAKKIQDHRFRIGVGAVFGNPDFKLKGRDRYLKRHLKGMHWGGYTAQVAYERCLYESDRFYINFETKLTYSFAKLPISDKLNEYAKVPDTAIHFNIGFGTKPLKSKSSLKDKALYISPILLPNLLYALQAHTVE